jgi:hypothetical protein
VAKPGVYLLPYVKQVNEVAATDFSLEEIASLRNLLGKFRDNLRVSDVDDNGELS